MPPHMNDVMRLCCEISAQDQIKVAVKNCTTGAMMAGGGAFVGGMLCGPPGMAMGKNLHVTKTPDLITVSVMSLYTAQKN